MRLVRVAEARPSWALELAEAMSGDDTRESLDTITQIWRRHKGLALALCAVGWACVIPISLALPDVYAAAATVLVQGAALPDDLARTSLAGPAGHRIRSITEQIMSRTNLDTLIDHFGLYQDMLAETSREVVYRRMRKDIELQIAETDPSLGMGPVAFSIEYTGRDPDMVASVANSLAGMYVDANAQLRSLRAEATSELIDVELAEVRDQLEVFERRIREFKMRYRNDLPQQLSANLAGLERANAELQVNTGLQLSLLERWSTALSGDDSGQPANFATAPPRVRLAMLEAELLRRKATLTEEHPKVSQLMSEIDGLQEQLRQSGGTGGPESSSELATLQRRERELRDMIQRYQERVERAPEREQALLELTRDYDAARERYHSLQARREEAQLAGRIEQSEVGGSFRLLDAAVPPVGPVAPPRDRLLVIGLVLCLCGAAGVALLRDRFDTSFRTAESLRRFTRVPVLGVIPEISTPGDAWRRRVRTTGLTLATVGCVALVGVASYYVANDNETLARLLSRMNAS
jgi:polysaccharide chain length determinant protein (PEP-CTERM system associated)